MMMKAPQTAATVPSSERSEACIRKTTPVDFKSKTSVVLLTVVTAKVFLLKKKPDLEFRTFHLLFLTPSSV